MQPALPPPPHLDPRWRRRVFGREVFGTARELISAHRQLTAEEHLSAPGEHGIDYDTFFEHMETYPSDDGDLEEQLAPLAPGAEASEDAEEHPAPGADEDLGEHLALGADESPDAEAAQGVWGQPAPMPTLGPRPKPRPTQKPWLCFRPAPRTPPQGPRAPRTQPSAAAKRKGAPWKAAEAKAGAVGAASSSSSSTSASTATPDGWIKLAPWKCASKRVRRIIADHLGQEIAKKQKELRHLQQRIWSRKRQRKHMQQHIGKSKRQRKHMV